MGPQITSVWLQVLNGNASMCKRKVTHLVLIPKIKTPTWIIEYRPISLCNVVARIVEKAMANRLKRIMHDIIDPEQSAFVFGRLITNNILVAFECLHTIRKRVNGRK